MTSIRQRLLMKVAEESLRYGVSLVPFPESPLMFFGRLPEAQMTRGDREQAAHKAANMVLHDNRFGLWLAIRALRKSNGEYETRQTVHEAVASILLESEKREALIEMLQLGLEADPLLAEVAGAESSSVIQSALASAREQAARPQALQP